MIRIPERKKNKGLGSRLFRPDSHLLFISLLAALTYLSQDHIFFWDTIQFAGKHGQWFYEQQFSSLLLPPEIDSGHPPVFGWYIASVWLVFGKSLPVSHWAMFPFLVGISWQLHQLARYELKSVPAYWLLLIALADPVFLGQSVLVSPDIALLFFFLWAFNSFWQDRPLTFAPAVLGLTAISTRGMMIVAAFGLYELIRRWPEWQRSSWPHRLAPFIPFLPAALFSLVFLLAHYLETGWIGYHPDSPWAPAFERVDAKGFGRNLLIFAWRWLDYGRVFLWLVFGYLLVKNRWRIRNGVFPISPHLHIPLFLLCLAALLSFSFLTYSGLQAHRYLLPVFLTFSILCVILVDRLAVGIRRTVLLWVMFLGLASGNFWIYPDRIAQGWDATPAHWPYYTLRDQMLDYLEEEAISIQAVGSAFPEIGPLQYRDLSGRSSGFREKDLASDTYILYSNIMNDFSDLEIAELQSNWWVQYKIERGGIKMILYRKP